MRPDAPQESPLFARGPSSTARLVLLSLASVLLMTADHRGNYLDRIRAALSVLTYPIQTVASFPADAGSWIAEEVTGRQALIEENRQLERELLAARGQLQRLAALRQENARLRELLDTAERRDEQAVVSEIERVDLDPFSHRVLIDRGTRDRVFEGQPVVDQSGVMGQVVETGPFSAYVMLISDPNHALPVELNRTGLRTIAFGTGSTDRLVLTDLPMTADVRPGDLLVTSGLGGHFPVGFPVARVTRIQRDPGQPFAQIEARPVAALDRSRLVLLIWPDGRDATPDHDNAPAGETEAEQ